MKYVVLINDLLLNNKDFILSLKEVLADIDTVDGEVDYINIDSKTDIFHLKKVYTNQESFWIDLVNSDKSNELYRFVSSDLSRCIGSNDVLFKRFLPFKSSSNFFDTLGINYLKRKLIRPIDGVDQGIEEYVKVIDSFPVQMNFTNLETLDKEKMRFESQLDLRSFIEENLSRIKVTAFVEILDFESDYLFFIKNRKVIQAFRNGVVVDAAVELEDSALIDDVCKHLNESLYTLKVSILDTVPYVVGLEYGIIPDYLLLLNAVEFKKLLFNLIDSEVNCNL